jgi:hypothetical protein
MPRWDEAARKKQSQMIRTWNPSSRSTGATTLEGQQRSRGSAFKHGKYCLTLCPELLACRDAMFLGDHDAALKSIYEFVLKQDPELAASFDDRWNPPE